MQIVRDVRAHHIDIRRKFRRLGNHRRIDVPDREAARGHECDDMTQQCAAICILPLVGRRKMRAEIAERECAENRVADRVKQHVGV